MIILIKLFLNDDTGNSCAIVNFLSLLFAAATPKERHSIDNNAPNTADNSHEPSSELLAFLASSSPASSESLSDSQLSHNSSNSNRYANKIIYVGFGSMKLEDVDVTDGTSSQMENVIGLFLEAAALMGVKIIVQPGWTNLTHKKFLDLALQVRIIIELKFCVVIEII